MFLPCPVIFGPFGWSFFLDMFVASLTVKLAVAPPFSGAESYHEACAQVLPLDSFGVLPALPEIYACFDIFPRGLSGVFGRVDRESRREDAVARRPFC